MPRSPRPSWRYSRAVPTPLFAASDIHGHRTELRAALHEAGLTDPDGNWAGADAHLCFLGDYFDRGPDGVGVVDDIRRLAEQAPATGGRVTPLLGNHEVQIVATYRFGDTPVPVWGSFGDVWRRWGGRESDLDRLTPDHVSWLLGLPVMALVDNFLLMHSDTDRYLELGDSVTGVNEVVAKILGGDDPEEWLRFCRLFNDRGSFRAGAAGEMLATYGGETIVHGHSTLISYFGFRPDQVREAHRYADGRVIAVDGGAFQGGRLLVTRLR
jgi:hypothetical protein